MEVTPASDRRAEHGPPAVQQEMGEAAMSTTTARLHGRGREQQQIDLLIRAARSRRSGALVLCGDAGTGKSALLEYATARANGMGVLRCQGDHAESDLPFAALHQLLQPVLPLVDELPERLSAPLAAALGLGAGDDEPDRFLVRASVLALLVIAARQRPLACVVDDGQWLDRSSADVLTFVARRLR